MGFHEFSSPYDWSRIASYKRTAKAAFGGMVDLSVGSPVDPVPDSVRKALAVSSNDPNAYGYPVTAGTADLRDAIHEWFAAARNVDLRAIGADAVPTVGSKEGVALMASLLHFGEGDVVVQPKVSYPTYEIGTQLAGAQTLKVDDVADADSWKDVPGVKAVWVNSPCNPTGEVLSAEADADTLASTPCALRADVCGGSAEGVLVLYSLSKQSNMAGYRTALIAGDQSLIGPMAAYRKQIGQIIPGPVQAAMAAGLRDFDAVKTQHSRYQERLGMLVSALRAYGYCTDMPQGALYVWVKAKSGDCWEDLRQLAEIGIVASPGEFYGAPEYLRFSATASDAAIASAAERLAR